MLISYSPVYLYLGSLVNCPNLSGSLLFVVGLFLSACFHGVKLPFRAYLESHLGVWVHLPAQAVTVNTLHGQTHFIIL